MDKKVSFCIINKFPELEHLININDGLFDNDFENICDIIKSSDGYSCKTSLTKQILELFPK